MFITDLEGNQLEVTDLPRAIAQAEDFVSFCHIETSPAIEAADLKRSQYWQDVLDKLKKLQNPQP